MHCTRCSVAPPFANWGAEAMPRLRDQPTGPPFCCRIETGMRNPNWQDGSGDPAWLAAHHARLHLQARQRLSAALPSWEVVAALQCSS